MTTNKQIAGMNTLIKNLIILELLEAGIEVTLKKDCIEIEGFYKSGIVQLYPLNDGTLLCKSRYEQEDVITHFSDLVAVNYDWYLKSKARGFEIDPKWASLYTKNHFMKRSTKERLLGINKQQ